MINSIIGRMLKNCVGSFNQIVLILHEKNESLFLKTLNRVYLDNLHFEELKVITMAFTTNKGHEGMPPVCSTLSMKKMSSHLFHDQC